MPAATCSICLASSPKNGLVTSGTMRPSECVRLLRRDRRIAVDRTRSGAQRDAGPLRHIADGSHDSSPTPIDQSVILRCRLVTEIAFGARTVECFQITCVGNRVMSQVTVFGASYSV